MAQRLSLGRVLSTLLSIIGFVFTFLVLCPAARPDDLDNDRFEGTVYDIAGAVIAGARVTARNAATGHQSSTTSDGQGRYRIVVAEPGTYSLKATAAGFSDKEHKEIPVSSGSRIVLNFELSPSGAAEQVTVAATAAPLIDTSRSVVGETITAAEVEALPLISRDPHRLVLLLGGATEAPLAASELADEGRGVFFRGTPEEAGMLSLTGAPATSNNITVDGLDNNDDRSARERITLSLESIAELQIITNQYAAEYGRASGGRINLRTRGGANRHHSDAYAFFADESLNANTFFRNARGLGRLPQHQLREGAAVSGPLRANKYFYFGSYERLGVQDFAEVSAYLPTKTNPRFPLPEPNRPPANGSAVALLLEEIATPETRNFINGRLDFNFGDGHNATLRSDGVRGANRRGFPGGTRLPDSILIEGRDSDSTSISDNLILSSRLVNQSRFQVARLLPRRSADVVSAEVVIEEPPRIVAGAFTGSQTSPAFERQERRLQIQDNLSVSAGHHFIKAGGDIQLLRSEFRDLFATGGQFTFDTVSDFLSNRPSRFVQRFDATSRLANDVLGIFAQDEWRIKQHVTLSFGARWDSESIISDRNNFSPRLAIAWDPFGAKLLHDRLGKPGNTVVHAGFGLFYNRALLRTIDDFSLGKSTSIVDSDLTPQVLSVVQFPAPITDRSLVSRFGVAETRFLRRTDGDLQIPYTLQTGLGVERKIGKNSIASVDYIFTRGAHLWRESNINAPIVPQPFSSLAEYLLSRDFDNRPDARGVRPISASSADVVRFTLGTGTSSSPGSVRTENGVRVLSLGLNAPRSGNIRAALNATRSLRPNPSLGHVELLEATGSSFYHGMLVSVRHSLGGHAHFRASYTLSKFIDEGTTNTASPQDLLDRRSERALSLQDQRHRFSFSGSVQVPRIKLEFAPILSFGSSRPFNIGAGADRNLNDIENDRPNFLGEVARPKWRRPGSDLAVAVREALQLAPVGSSGNLPRNYGRGPGTQTIDLRASRNVSLGDRVKLRPSVDVFNLFNSAIFSLGAEFINRDDPDFLVPRRTQRPRTIHLSLRLSF